MTLQERLDAAKVRQQTLNEQHAQIVVQGKTCELDMIRIEAVIGELSAALTDETKVLSGS